MVQSVGNENKRPGVLPYALGGTAAGAAAGWGLSKLDFTKAAKYSSWQDILKDSKDLFKAAKEEGASEAVKEAKTAIESAKTTFKDAVKNLSEHSDAYKNLSQYADRNTALEAYKTKLADFVSQAKEGKLGFDAAGKTGDELTKAAKEHVNKLVKNGDDKVKDLKDALTALKDKNKALKDHVTKEKVQVFKETTENITKTVKEASDKAWESVKDKVKDFKKPRTAMLAAGLAAVGLVAGLLLRPKAKPAEEAQA